MNKKSLIALTIIWLAMSAPAGFCAQKGAAAAEFSILESKIKAKLGEGKKSEQDLAPELKEFDALVTKYKAEKTDEGAELLLMEANLYLQVFDNTEKGAELVRQLQRDFPETTLGKNAYQMLEEIKKQETANKLQAALQVGTKFPDFNEKDVTGKPLSLTNFQGRVVLIDFWAMWCAPCVTELPNLLKTFETYHAKGFEIIGINLDNDAKKLDSFIQEKNITWPQFCDGQGWQNRLAVKYGVHRIPTTYLLDGEGKIIGKDLHGQDLHQAVAKAFSSR
jgi:peroxiredoxin